MNKYAKIALLAAKDVELGIDPVIAWEKASKIIFTSGSSSQKKGCPKNAFLGLYGGKGKNAEYAQKALNYLKANKSNEQISEIDLWNIVTENVGKSYNSQMHVVKALFKEKYI